MKDDMVNQYQYLSVLKWQLIEDKYEIERERKRDRMVIITIIIIILELHEELLRKRAPIPKTTTLAESECTTLLKRARAYHFPIEKLRLKTSKGHPVDRDNQPLWARREWDTE